MNWPTDIADATWINERTRDSQRVNEVIERLTALILPNPAWNSDSTLNPLEGNFDQQSWPWNHAANSYLNNGIPKAAAEVWAAMYLAMLSLQQAHSFRFHKGLALCNIGFALQRSSALERSGETHLQRKCWLLGLIEDACTSIEGARAQQNHQNLLSSIPHPILRQLIATVQTRFLDLAITPQLPERVIDFWFHPGLRLPTESCLNLTSDLLAKLRNSYPRLPETASFWHLLETAWGFFDPSILLP